MEIKKVSPGLAIGGQPGADDLRSLAEDGFKTVVNLRMPGEAAALSPEEAREIAERLHMCYFHIPLDRKRSSDAVIWEVTEAIARLKADGPVFVH